jgi:hypothetical protein
MEISLCDVYHRPAFFIKPTKSGQRFRTPIVELKYLPESATAVPRLRQVTQFGPIFKVSLIPFGFPFESSPDQPSPSYSYRCAH